MRKPLNLAPTLLAVAILANTLFFAWLAWLWHLDSENILSIVTCEGLAIVSNLAILKLYDHFDQS